MTGQRDRGELRRRAEARLARLRLPDGADAADVHRLVHELQVHEVELELQNEELRASRAEAEALLRRYTELFDFGPIGYVHVGEDGRIRAANFAARARTSRASWTTCST